MPHVTAVLLADLWRKGQHFPPLAGPRAQGGFAHVTAAYGEGRLICNGQYIEFRCPACLTLLFEPNTDRGLAHALRVSAHHKPACCAERAFLYRASGIVTAWPD